MIDQNTEKRLEDIYQAISLLPGWLGHCYRAGFMLDEIVFLETLDEEIKESSKQKEINSWTKEVEKAGGHEVFLIENEDEKILFLSKQIENEYLKIEGLLNSNEPYAQVRGLVLELKKKLNTRNKIRTRQVFVNNKDKKFNSVQDWEIKRAKDVPLEKVIGDKLKNKRMPCPFHRGKDNNFSVKDGWGYCFVCNKSCDSLKYAMEIQGMKFVDAVNYLNRL